MKQDYDVVIVGGGLAGNCLALALQGSDLKIAIIEASTREQLHHSPAGNRALALAGRSVSILDALGIWAYAKVLATAIKTIHISDQGHFGKTRLAAAQEGVEAFGYVMMARDLEEIVAQLVDRADIVQINPARVIGIASKQQQVHISLNQQDRSMNISAKLVVGADGGHSTVRKLLGIEQTVTKYQQVAIITRIKTEIAHENVAYERFTCSGPLALLPFKQDYAVIWTRQQESVKQLLTASEDEFLASLQACFGYKLGRFSLTAPRYSFPLSLVRAKSMYSGRTVIIGNAAHQLHPVAGQGLNLGLRDAVQLAEMLLNAAQQGNDIGTQALLEDYAKQRQKDHNTVINFTHSLVKLFSNQRLSLAVARNAGLTLLDMLPSTKRQLARYAMGINTRMPHIGTRRRV